MSPRAVFLLVLPAFALNAQAPDSQRVVLGPYAGLAWSPVRVTVNDGEEQTTGGIGLHFGVGFRPFARWGGNAFLPQTLRRVRLTPHFALTASHLRGIDPAIDSVAFSEFSLFGMRLSLDVAKRLHVFGVMRQGKRTAEIPQRQGNVLDVDNIWGNAVTLGGGINVPLAKSGRGIEVAVLTSRGNFTSREVVDRVTNEHLDDASVRIPFRALWIQVGWSGPFTGASLPWE